MDPGNLLSCRSESACSKCENISFRFTIEKQRFLLLLVGFLFDSQWLKLKKHIFTSSSRPTNSNILVFSMFFVCQPLCMKFGECILSAEISKNYPVKCILIRSNRNFLASIYSDELFSALSFPQEIKYAKLFSFLLFLSCINKLRIVTLIW